MKTELQSLIKKLNGLCLQSIQAAAELCVSNTNYNVEVEHLVLQLLGKQSSDIEHILNHFAVKADKAVTQCTRAIDKLKRGNSRTPAMSPHILTLLQQAWMISSMTLEKSHIQSGAILVGLLTDPTLRGLTLDSIPALLQIPLKALTESLEEIVKHSAESGAENQADKATVNVERIPGNELAYATRALDQFTINLTERVRNGEMDPVEGRDREIKQMIDILMRRRQNNPILTGDAGVGKTAIVEGLAHKIVSGEVPSPLKDVSIHMLDLGLLQAGAGVKGEFEQRLKDVVNEVKASPTPVILFVDEAHSLIGAGGQAGQNDAANLLKPSLARGELKTIAATTWSEYKKYFEKDHALVRRFQVIQVSEPHPDEAVFMLRSVAKSLEQYHQVRILDEAIVDAVKLSHRYLSGRKLPDKAVSLLDTACSRIAVGQDTTPAPIEDAQRNLKRLQQEIDILTRDGNLNGRKNLRISELQEDQSRYEAELTELQRKWETERQLIDRVRTISLQLKPSDPFLEEDEALKQTLMETKTALHQLQGSQPMAHVEVNSDIVASVLSGWTGIPVKKMMTDEIKSVLFLKDKMEKRLIGQSHALEAVCKRIRTSRAGLDDPGKPIGVFLLVGPSGVGKTETALTLADLLYGGNENVITVNMSEYQEAHTVSTLKGAPPGYVGYGSGGILTEAVRRRPFSVVLLDEVEKAHPDVMELFYQVFDKGTLEDGEGVGIDFKNTVILLTTNLASEIISQHCSDLQTLPDPERVLEMIRPRLSSHFKPALLSRLVVIPYLPLRDEQIRQIVTLKIDRIKKRFQENNHADLQIDPDLIDAVSSRCNEVESGARNIDAILSHHLLPELSKEVLLRLADGKEFQQITVSLDDQGEFTFNSH